MLVEIYHPMLLLESEKFSRKIVDLCPIECTKSLGFQGLRPANVNWKHATIVPTTHILSSIMLEFEGERMIK